MIGGRPLLPLFRLLPALVSAAFWGCADGSGVGTGRPAVGGTAPEYGARSLEGPRITLADLEAGSWC